MHVIHCHVNSPRPAQESQVHGEVGHMPATDTGTDATRTNLRGDLLPIAPGLDVRAVNTAGGLAGDRLRFVESFSAFLPVGFYYKAFHTPRALFPFYERQMRKAAGLGRINPALRA